jgi:AbrB family looped-hinge helix DNA binding protein
MMVSEKGQVTIPKHIRAAAGVLPGSQVSFSLDGGRIVITPTASRVGDDRRSRLQAAAAKVRASMHADFRQLPADEVMAFLRGTDATAAASALEADTHG